MSLPTHLLNLSAPLLTVGLLLPLPLGCGSSGDAADTDGGTGEGDDEGDTGTPQGAPMCDGSQDMRFAYTIEGKPSGLYEAEEAFGSYYLYVRGDCTYWAYHGDENSNLKPPRMGTISEEQADEIAAKLGYWDLPEVAGGYPLSAGGDFSGFETYKVVSNFEETVYCAPGCEDDADTPPEIAEFTSPGVRFETISELQNSGDPLESPRLHVTYVQSHSNSLPAGFDPATYQHEAWPFSVGPSEEPFAEIESVSFTANSRSVTFKMDAGDLADEMRVLRDQYLAGDIAGHLDNSVAEAAASTMVFHTVEPGDEFRTHRVYFREMPPFEGEAAGSIPAP